MIPDEAGASALKKHRKIAVSVVRVVNPVDGVTGIAGCKCVHAGVLHSYRTVNVALPIGCVIGWLHVDSNYPIICATKLIHDAIIQPVCQICVEGGLLFKVGASAGCGIIQSNEPVIISDAQSKKLLPTGRLKIRRG